MFAGNFLFAVLLPAYTLAPVAPPWAPKWLKYSTFDTRSSIRRIVLTLQAAHCALRGEVTCNRLRFPVLIVHGSSQSPTYPTLASSFADSGHVVLTYDQRGYGRPPDPEPLSHAGSFDYTGDVVVTIDALAAYTGWATRHIVVVGHRFGSDVVLTSAADEDLNARRVVLFGPARRYFESGGYRYR